MVRENKLLQFINCRLRLTMQDGRILIGQLLAYDKYMNLVMADVEEIRSSKSSSDPIKRTLGFIVLRGKHITSFTAEGVPIPVDANRLRISAASLIAGTRPAEASALNLPPPGAVPLAKPSNDMF